MPFCLFLRAWVIPTLPPPARFVPHFCPLLYSHLPPHGTAQRAPHRAFPHRLYLQFCGWPSRACGVRGLPVAVSRAARLHLPGEKGASTIPSPAVIPLHHPQQRRPTLNAAYAHGRTAFYQTWNAARSCLAAFSRQTRTTSIALGISASRCDATRHLPCCPTTAGSRSLPSPIVAGANDCAPLRICMCRAFTDITGATPHAALRGTVRACARTDAFCTRAVILDTFCARTAWF